MDELLGKRIPYSAEAEQAVIGSMLIDPACVTDVVDKINAAEFYSDANRDIFETMYSMFSYGQAIDPVTVLDQMKGRGVYKENSPSYIRELMEVTPTAANVLQYCAIVRDKALLRNLGAVSTEIGELVYKGGDAAETALELAEQKVYALRQGRTSGGLVPISSVMKSLIRQISDAASRDETVPGLTTGLADLDECLLGLNKGDFILIASRPGMGKTSIALNMTMHVAKTSGKTVAVFSLEMAREQLAIRLLANESHVDGLKLNTGRLSPEDWQRIGLAAASISATDIRIDDNPTLTVADMLAQCRRIKDLGLVVIDYLQLMQSAGSGHGWSNESRTQAVSDMSRMLKIMAKELNVPVVCLSQLSRANESREDKRPRLSDLRESGSIEQDADIVIGLFREGYYKKDAEDPSAAEAIVLKNRRGRVGTIDLRWIPEYTAYVSAEKRHME